MVSWRPVMNNRECSRMSAIREGSAERARFFQLWLITFILSFMISIGPGSLICLAIFGLPGHPINYEPSSSSSPAFQEYMKQWQLDNFNTERGLVIFQTIVGTALFLTSLVASIKIWRIPETRSLVSRILPTILCAILVVLAILDANGPPRTAGGVLSHFFR